MSFDPFDERLYTEFINEAKGFNKPPDPNSNRSKQKIKDAEEAQTKADYMSRREQIMAKKTAEGYNFVIGFGHYMYNDPQLIEAWKNTVLSAKKAGVFNSLPSVWTGNGRNLYRDALYKMALKFINEHKLIKHVPDYNWKDHGDDSLAGELIGRAEEFLYIDEDEGDGRGGKGGVPSGRHYPDPINHKTLALTPTQHQ